MKIGFIYILASKIYGTIYIGVTDNIVRRIHEHKHDLREGFTRRYQLHRLVYYEIFSGIELAIQREKQLKNWRRSWKINLIEQKNPEWKDLSKEIKL